ncbi:beta-mannosidase [Clostridium thermarum]|uniref:beta-mannosidase n=1 Tax=Clostridium thermarum TaxID=1716543 RepID=UPI0013D680B6|nr:sugar-binding domain-containing protein [Clostridium thermarum]
MKILLKDNWKLQCFEEDSVCDTILASADVDLSEWLDVEVPGDVHSTLLKYKKIEDPFYSTNAEKCRWIEDKTWWYKKSFNFERELQESDKVELKFNGLDTFATVYLNGEVLGRHENMFTPATFDVTEKLLQGTNHVAVKFDSTISVTNRKSYDKMWYSYNPNRVWARKAQMNFRWDWGPRLITVGIWKEVELNLHNTAKIDNVYVRTVEIRDNEADLMVSIEAESFKDNIELTAVVKLNGEGCNISETIALKNGRGEVKLTVTNPKLWWTHDLGTPYLYNFNVDLLTEDKNLDSYNSKVGIRTVKVRQEDALGNKRFIFVLNGVETFSKGANWVPAHNFIGAIKDETYVKWVTNAKDCNMNMLRVWGGGVYEKDIFYQECDKQGLLVWQDFMFTCSSYPDFDADFMKNVREEIIHVVKYYRNYTCIAIWCGNNEIQWLHGQKLSDLKDLRLYGEKIYHDLMPELLAAYDPSRLFWPSSPFGGNDPNSDEEGDKHNWQVWAGQVYPRKYGEAVIQNNTAYGVSFKRYTEDLGKFVSEFGMHALPVKETLEACIPKEELYFESFEMKFRNKDKRPNRGKLLMEGYTGLPVSLEEYIDFSMMAQAEGLKFGIEHYRRRKPECSGAIIWQLNDCWPTMSWSITDHYLRPKAGYYYTKRVYKPILLSFKQESNDIISLWAINDTLSEYKDTLEIGLKDFFGNKEYIETISIRIPANTSRKVKEFSKNRINVTYSNFEFLYVKPENRTVDSNIFFFEDYKDLNLPPCKLTIGKVVLNESKMIIKIKADNFAKFVKLTGSLDNVKLSDNYFDIMPGEERNVILEVLDKKIKLEELNIVISAINQRQAE